VKTARRKELSIKLDRCWKIEETKAWQRSRDRDIKEGDKNIAYFFAKANHRKRKKTITNLEENGVSYTDKESSIKLFLEKSREKILNRMKTSGMKGTRLPQRKIGSLKPLSLKRRLKKLLMDHMLDGHLVQMVSPSCSTKSSGLSLRQTS
jgi:adenine specific DNA methylase Mod